MTATRSMSTGRGVLDAAKREADRMIGRPDLRYAPDMPRMFRGHGGEDMLE